MVRATKLLNRSLSVLEIPRRQGVLSRQFQQQTQLGHACIVTKSLGADLSDKPNIKEYRKRLLNRKALQNALNIE